MYYFTSLEEWINVLTVNLITASDDLDRWKGYECYEQVRVEYHLAREALARSQRALIEAI